MWLFFFLHKMWAKIIKNVKIMCLDHKKIPPNFAWQFLECTYHQNTHQRQEKATSKKCFITWSKKLNISSPKGFAVLNQSFQNYSDNFHQLENIPFLKKYSFLQGWMTLLDIYEPVWTMGQKQNRNTRATILNGFC